MIRHVSNAVLVCCWYETPRTNIIPLHYFPIGSLRRFMRKVASMRRRKSEMSLAQTIAYWKVYCLDNMVALQRIWLIKVTGMRLHVAVISVSKYDILYGRLVTGVHGVQFVTKYPQNCKILLLLSISYSN